MNNNWLERTELLLGTEKLAMIQQAHVLVVGLGGVGAYAAEMLTRSGVGKLTIVDADCVSLSNINRQLIALHSTIGTPKANILAERLRDINPGIELDVLQEFIKDDMTDALLDRSHFDYIVDAIDTLAPKVNLIKGALDRDIPLVSSMGAGLKPTQPYWKSKTFQISPLSVSTHAPQRLHKLGIRSGFQVVFSPEPVREGSMILCEETNKKSNVGTISYMPALFGCYCASIVIRGLIGEM